MIKDSFRKELEALINQHSMENGSNTPDFVLSNYLCSCLTAFDDAVNARKVVDMHNQPIEQGEPQ